MSLYLINKQIISDGTVILLVEDVHVVRYAGEQGPLQQLLLGHGL